RGRPRSPSFAVKDIRARRAPVPEADSGGAVGWTPRGGCRAPGHVSWGAMPPRPLRSATLSFGLVPIPVRFYTATSSQSPHFHLVHEQCGSRIRQQLFCPACDRVVERRELVRGYELSGDSEHGGQHVLFTDDELRALETAASPSLDITEFVPL